MKSAKSKKIKFLSQLNFNAKSSRYSQIIGRGLTMRSLILMTVLIIASCSSPVHQNKEEKFKIIKSKTKQTERLSHVDYNKIFENDVVDGIAVELFEIGKLNIPTGKIVVCDPLVLPNTPPFTKTVRPGKYPVKIYIAKTKQWGDRYAVAKLEFSSKKADKWVLATQGGQDISKLKHEDDFFGFPVDAGLAGFFDYNAGIDYNNFVKNLIVKNPGGDIYDDFLAAEFKKNAKEPNNPDDAGDWVNFKIPNTNNNMMMFRSGYGDGTYPVYWGMTKDNEVVSLVIDFFVLLQSAEKQ
jgi:hypothetical protein